MILKIPKGQACQAFDPMMYLPEKTYKMDLSAPLNTSCVAPAYVYLEGARGKRFLCDFHYFYEKNMTSARDRDSWSKIEKVFIDERERIKETFAKLNYDHRTFKKKCWCDSEAFVSFEETKKNHTDYFCNFHYRKKFYRELSNGIDPLKDVVLVDERSLMKIKIYEESENIKWV